MTAPNAGLKTPQHSIEAEQAVVGGLMLSKASGEAWDIVADLLSKQDFYRYDHALIFTAIQEIRDQESVSDFVTVAEHLDRKGQLEEAGGPSYLRDLTRSVPSAANIEYYAKIVKARAIQREMSQLGDKIDTLAHEPEGKTAEELIDQAESMVYALSDKTSKMSKGPRAIKEALLKAVEKIDHLFDSQESITGVPSGLTDFDELTAGLQPADLVILAARPSMGKTSFAMGVAENAAIKNNIGVLVFSMEMPETQIAMRMISSVGSIDSHRLRTGKLSDDEWPKLTQASGTIAEKPIFIDDTAALTPTELRSRARRLARKHDIGLIVIDYLQLMQIPDARSRTEEISEISRQLKSLAKELNVPVIALSQLNRALEQRPNKRPVMSDLRESGGLEQDADLIVFLYRDEVYNEDSPDKGVAEIIIAKHRNGPIGGVRVGWKGQYTRFENCVPQSDDRDPSDYGKEGYYEPGSPQ